MSLGPGAASTRSCGRAASRDQLCRACVRRPGPATGDHSHLHNRRSPRAARCHATAAPSSSSCPTTGGRVHGRSGAGPPRSDSSGWRRRSTGVWLSRGSEVVVRDDRGVARREGDTARTTPASPRSSVPGRRRHCPSRRATVPARPRAPGSASGSFAHGIPTDLEGGEVGPSARTGPTSTRSCGPPCAAQPGARCPRPCRPRHRRLSPDRPPCRSAGRCRRTNSGRHAVVATMTPSASSSHPARPSAAHRPRVALGRDGHGQWCPAGTGRSNCRTSREPRWACRLTVAPVTRPTHDPQRRGQVKGDLLGFFEGATVRDGAPGEVVAGDRVVEVEVVLLDRVAQSPWPGT